MPYPVVSCVSAVVDNKIYVIGGQDEFEQDMNLKVVQIYDPTVNAWTLGQSAPAVVWQASAGATTGAMAPKRIYVIGGMEGFAEPLDSNYAYDPEADAWSSAASVPTARYGPACAVVDDQLYVIGGGIGFPLGTKANERYAPIGYGSPLPAETQDTLSPSPTQDSTPTPEPEQTQPTSPAPSPAPQERTPPRETENLPIFPTTLVAGLSLVSAVAVSAGFMFYFKKRKR